MSLYFCEVNKLNTKKIIEGICLDPRMEIFITIFFWLWWLLFAKRYQQLLENYRDIPNSIISAVIEANIKKIFYSE